METILSLDLGSTYLKAALFDREMRLLALSRLPAPGHSPQKGWEEIRVEDFHNRLGELTAQLRETCPKGYEGVAAVTFATQANSFLLMDGDDRALTPILLWSDERAAESVQTYRRIETLPEFQRTTGMPGLGHQFAVAKLAWIKSHQPELFAAARKFCLISDFLTFWLTGRHITEGGTAGLTGLLNIHTLKWWPSACTAGGVPLELLPEVVRAGTDLGVLRAETAKAWNLPENCKFIAGCLDQYAGAIGAGNNRPGDVSETTGTVLATVRCANRFSENIGGAYQGPSFHEGWYWQMLFSDQGASLLETFRNLQPDRPDFPTLDNEAESIPPGADGLRLVGPLTSNPEDAFAGLTPKHTRGHMVRCIMETVAFTLADQIRAICGDDLPTHLRCCGGATRSHGWLQIKADVLNIPCAPPTCPEPACLGAALLAAESLGWKRHDNWPKESSSANWITPRPDIHRLYRSIAQRNG